MANVKNVLGLLVGVTLCAVPAARAQSSDTTKLSVSVNYGWQTVSKTAGVLHTSASKFPIYEETATASSDQTVNSGPVFDVGVGYRVWKNLGAGVVFWQYKDTETAITVARIPDQIFFGRPRTVNLTTPDLERKEQGASLHAIWNQRLTNRLSLALSGGLAVIKVSQELIGDFTVPPGTQNVNLVTTTENPSGTGPYAGVDGIFMITRYIGAGGYIRYAGAKVELAGVADSKIGGMQAGAGVRLRLF